jgi:small conductance mechanosensitive channel
MDLTKQLEFVEGLVAAFGMKLIGAFALWWAGRLLIGFAMRMTRRALLSRQIDATLQQYLVSTLTVVLNVVLVIGILGFFGVETTSFAALLAAAGVAIGAAWSGLLANFAAGAFIVMLRPFKVGDIIEAGGATGTVREIGLFSTSVLSADNVLTLVGNAKILGDNIRNFSATRHRLILRDAVVPTGTPLHDAVAMLRARLAALPNVLADPAPEVAIVDLVDDGVKVQARLAVRPEHFGAVLDEVNRGVCAQFGPAA